MQRALASSIGLPSTSTSALWMLAFLIPAEVSNNRTLPLAFVSSHQSERRKLEGPRGWAQLARAQMLVASHEGN